ncbi:MAG: MGMT family protein [Elusimicrobiota bacterium]|jgi:O-6-methylguanine DNA methyltransferase
MKNYSPFYQKVWKACSKIPRGQTRTYGQLAKAIGHPGAARAVGQALAANPFAPRVPCHRVVCTDGSLGGYSAPGGVHKKRLLLRREWSSLGKRGVPLSSPFDSLRSLRTTPRPGAKSRARHLGQDRGPSRGVA